MGLAGTELLVKDGWYVTMFDFNAEGAKVAAKLGEQVLFVQGNALVYDDQVRAFKQTWDKWGRIDVVWANAGFGDAQDFFRPAAAVEGEDGMLTPPRPNTLTVDVCLTGVIFTTYLALHFFRKTPTRPGKLILQSSVNGLWPNSRLILYSAAKHGVVGLTRALAARLRETDEQISVNAICPGLVDTPLISSTMIDNIPAHMKTPMSTIMRAFSDIVHDQANTSGQVLEASGPDVIPKDPPPYGNDATEYIVELRYRDLIDVGVLAKHGEERGKARKAMEVAPA
ncbi:hypothetical protein PV04_03462 [Phialophora macrospora]|uniref:Uncharacterized protein n=1 Tax=Phialophora macrospora TaxID=1851006 RepID=A0A0D2GG99_9EURO|nr:hypothetical protein PV04_03462 [Phialophora macrospora]